MARSRRHRLLAATRAMPALLTFVNLFLPWWVIDVQSNLGNDYEEVRPFDPGRLGDDGDQEGLTTEAWFGGVFILIAATAGIAHAVLTWRDDPTDDALP